MQTVLNNRTVPVTAQAPLALRLQTQNGLQAGLSLSTPSHDTLSLNSRLSPSPNPALHFGRFPSIREILTGLRRMSDIETNSTTGLRKGFLGDDRIGPRVSLLGPDLSNLDLRKADLLGASIRGANLRGAELRDAELSLTDLSGVDLSGAKNLPPSILDSSIFNNSPAFYNPYNPPTLAEGLTYGRLANRRIVPAENRAQARYIYEELDTQMRQGECYQLALLNICRRYFPGSPIPE